MKRLRNGDRRPRVLRPGESGNADIGISLPGRGESPVAPVYCDGVKKASLKGDDIMNEFKAMIEAYVAERWGVR